MGEHGLVGGLVNRAVGLRAIGRSDDTRGETFEGGRPAKTY